MELPGLPGNPLPDIIVEKERPTGYKVVDDGTTTCFWENYMALRINFRLLVIVALVATLCTMSGCYTTPVRHLAADVSLLKIGESTAEEVLIFLGPPDEQQEQGDAVEKWLYRDKDMTLIEKTPLVGKHLGSPEYKQVVVTITNNIVSGVVYSASDDDELDWADDYSWQEKKK
jgi:hypothetical protein